MTGREERPQHENDCVSIEAYGVKTEIRAGDLGYTSPTSLSDVLDIIKSQLLKLMVLPFAIPAALGEGVIRIVNGLSGLPRAAASRLLKGRDLADKSERRKQSGLRAERTDSISTDQLPPDRDGAASEAQMLVTRLGSILENIRASGHDAAVVPFENGFLIVLGTPTNSRAAIEHEALRLLSSTVEPKRDQK